MARSFAIKDQSSLTIARLLMDHIISWHGVLGELLSDRGKLFLIYDIYRLLDIKKVNTTAYHPQTDGLVERFNRRMLARDEHLSYILFAYRSSVQESTKESPFYLLCLIAY